MNIATFLCEQDTSFAAQGLFFDDAEPQLADRFGWGAIEKFFSLNDSDAWHLFGDTSYPSQIVTPQDVIARIQDLLEST